MEEIETKPFLCPNCGHKIEKKHAFFLNNFTVIRCSKCKKDLVPELRKTASIGLLYGSIGGLLGFCLPVVSALFGYPLIGIVMALLIGLFMYFSIVSKSINTVSFYVKR